MQNYRAPDNFLSSKVILVTGASDGIGKQAALTYAQYGATLVLLGRDTRKLEAVYDEIEQNGSAKPAYLPVNFQNPDAAQYKEIAQVIEQEFGKLDIIVHNAGDLGILSPIEHYDLDTWNRVMQVNVNAQFMLTQACIPLLKQSEDASIIFTSSGVGRQGRAYWGAYAISKFATEGMMQVLADELECFNIRVNSINPGATRTNMRANAYPGEDPNTLPKPEQLMTAYCWLLDPATGKSGQAINARDFIKEE